MAPFYGWGSTTSRLEPLRGGSLLFTTTDACFLFSYFCCSLIPVSNTLGTEGMLTLLYQYKWQKLNKINEKRSLEYHQSVSTEYVILNIAASFEISLPFDFCTVSKILIEWLL